MCNEIGITYIDHCQISALGMRKLLEGRCVNSYTSISEYLIYCGTIHHRKNELVIISPRKDLAAIEHDVFMLRKLIYSYNQRLIIFGDSNHLSVGYMSALIKPDLFIDRTRTCMEIGKDILNFMLVAYFRSTRIEEDYFIECDRLTKKEFIFLKTFIDCKDMYKCSVRMAVSYKTASAHLCNILKKYRIKNKLHLISML